jgi:hypothetical protein
VQAAKGETKDATKAAKKAKDAADWAAMLAAMTSPERAQFIRKETRNQAAN